ncbi:MAG: 4-hydroxythreonine-4-phosphate dehydrogenase PdxA [Candidatus Omnitrophota bacterium]|nr:4-hydroxythreonine-4-phosphate dehydrogenase PdxA [Candidatus Omnitrophota bacterium]
MTKLIVTSGDPAGCGPLITLKAIYALIDENADFFVVGDKKILQDIPVYEKVKKRINLIDLNSKEIEKIKKGYISKKAGIASLNYLNKALQILEKEKIKRLVTAPLSKEATKLAFRNFSGHTEYLADYFGAKNIAMAMVSQKLKVVLFTRHRLLREVPKLIDKGRLINTFSLVYYSLQNMFKIKKPRIAVTSLNPHAGIDTFLDREEKIVCEAIEDLKKIIYGPYPSDTIFIEQNLKKYDCIICLYHDQAMIPFKLLSLKSGVNLTLGLPIIRTSPAHGVAYDIMRKDKIPFHSSMVEAIKLAIRLKI